MLTIRRAENKDIPGILELLVQVNMVHHTGRPDIFKGPTTKYDAKQLAEIIADETTPVFVCTDENDKVIGHGFCIHRQHENDQLLTDIRTLYIDDICVDENSRGQHVGRKLYNAIKEYAESQGCYNITLNVWSFNSTAESFYRNLGFKPLKTEMEVRL